MKVKILTLKSAPFKTLDGDQVEYFWYKARRVSDDVTIEFGSKNGMYNPDSEYDLFIEKYERPNGKIGYKEVKEDVSAK